MSPSSSSSSPVAAASPAANNSDNNLFVQRAARWHAKVPLLRRLPPRAVAAILLLALVNLLVWAAAGVVLAFHHALSGTAVLAYTLGLRHALDADHISAIDLMTRRLVASGQKPVSVGTWFSLGHSSVVIVTCVVVAATSAAVSRRFDGFSRVGGIVGSSVSAAFLLLLGLANVYILCLLLRQMRTLLRARRSGNSSEAFQIKAGGVMFRLLSKAFKVVDRPWKMYPLGVLFGLGFDTSSEIALLGIASVRAGTGTSLWLIMLFPLLFTAGMCLLDTADGALMMSLYTSASLAKDEVAILYYNIVLTCLTCLVAAFVGVLQVFGLCLAILGDRADGSRFWSGVSTVEDRYDAIGGAICALFLLVGAASVLCYPHWRRWVDDATPSAIAEPSHNGTAAPPATASATSDTKSVAFVSSTDIAAQPQTKNDIEIV